MPAVEFHILTEAGQDVRYRHVCALVEQSQSAGECVFIRAEPEILARLDDLLWTFRDQAFIPHEPATGNSPSHPRIVAVLGGDEPMPAGFTWLINLHPTLPPQLSQANKIVEVIDGDVTVKQQARERYKQYREQGCQLDTINH